MTEKIKGKQKISKVNVFAAAAIIACVVALSSCGSASAQPETSVDNEYYADDLILGESADFSAPMASAAPEEEAYSGGAEQVTDSERKIIKTADLSLLIKDFDNTVEGMKTRCEELGGYVEYYGINSRSGQTKSGSLTLRVPSDSYDTLVAELGAMGELLSLSEYSDDQTQVYQDTSRRLELSMTEEARLVEMLDMAANVEELIAIEERLASVRYEIEFQQSRLSGIDRRASFSTIRLNLSDDPEAVIMPVSGNLGERIVRGFTDSVNGVAAFFGDAVVFLAGAVVPVAVIGLLALAGVWVYRRRRKRDDNGAER